MKKLLFSVFAVMVFAACTQNEAEEFVANRADIPETLTVGFEGGDDTRIQLNNAQKTVWNAGDEVSVFYKSFNNLKWQFQGATGDRSGVLKMVDGDAGAQTLGHVVVAYPYSTSYKVGDSGLEAILPATQTYLNGSYGEGGNIMVAQSEFTQFTLKNVCGWLRIQLTGEGQKVRKITLRGNNDEQLAGLVYIDTETAEVTLATEIGGYDDEENSVGGGLMFEDSIITEITLNCGEGVELGTTAKSFYIGLLPQTFENGATALIECTDGTSKSVGTTNKFTLQRNHILPIDAGEYDAEVPEVYELAYRTNDGKKLDPITTEGFGAGFVENQYDASTGEGKLLFAGAVTAIPEQAFGLCENLTWIDLPLGVASIGASAFSGCTSLAELTIPASVTYIGGEAFKNCSIKATIHTSDVSYQGVGFTEVVIGDNVTTLCGSMFDNCDSLTKVTISDSVTTIGRYAFYDCDALTTVIMSDSVSSVGYRAFYSCDNISDVYITNLPAWCGISFYDYDSNPLYYADNLYLNGELVTDLVIPGSVDTVGKYAFYGYSQLHSLYVESGVATIGDRAFYNCDSLVDVTIESGLTTLGSYSFYDCSNLVSVALPDSATTIGSDAFRNCYALRNITIPASIESIGNSAFGSCSSLNNIYCMASTAPSMSGAFATGVAIYVPEESVRKYKIAEGWSSYADAIVGYDYTQTWTFGYTTTDYNDDVIYPNLPVVSNTCSNGVGELTLYGTTESFPNNAFVGCDNLDGFTGSYASTDGTSLIVGNTLVAVVTDSTSFTIPSGITAISNGAFSLCPNLVRVVCNATTPPTIGANMFNINANFAISVPASSISDYLTAWSEYKYYIFKIADRSGYKVGDLVTVDGVAGVVYFVSDAMVRVVSAARTSCEWGLYGTYVGADSYYNGRYNVAAVKANGYFDELPAFVWCEELGDGWYLPARYELQAIYDVKDALNTTLIDNSYEQLSGYYWSSSELDNCSAYYVSFSHGLWTSYGKDNYYNVRAVRAF